MANSFFTDRSVQYPGRVQLTHVSGDVYDLTRAEGTVTQEGTELNAANLNGAMDACNTYTDQQTSKVYETKSASKTLSSNAFFNETISLGTKDAKVPVIAGWNVTGTNTSYCYVMGVIIEGNATNGWSVRFRGKNLNTSSSISATLVAQILWMTV